MQRPNKFTVQTKVMDFASKISDVVNGVICKKHQAKIGDPCWSITGDGSAVVYAGICNSRAKKQYNGRISEFSSRTAGSQRRPKKEHS